MACSNGQEIQAVIFDLDGVVTCTMRAHFAAWREVFDSFLRTNTQSEQTFVPFSIHDYFTHVDGVPRLEGIRRFLNSRDIVLPEGAPDDMDSKTMHGLASIKNKRYLAWLEANEVPTYSDALNLIGSLKRRGIKIGIFSSSQNCKRQGGWYRRGKASASAQARSCGAARNRCAAWHPAGQSHRR